MPPMGAGDVVLVGQDGCDSGGRGLFANRDVHKARDLTLLKNISYAGFKLPNRLHRAIHVEQLVCTQCDICHGHFLLLCFRGKPRLHSLKWGRTSTTQQRGGSQYDIRGTQFFCGEGSESDNLSPLHMLAICLIEGQLLRRKDSRHGDGLSARREHGIVFTLNLLTLILPVVS